MIEEIIINYLNSRLTVNVYAEEPEEKEDKYIVIEKTGGYIENYISHATVAIKSYADTLFNASMLNEEVKEKMMNIIELENIQSSKFNSDYNFTDQTKKKYRDQAVFELIY